MLFESLSESCYGLAHVIMHVHKCLLLNICGCSAFESMLEEERVVFFSVPGCYSETQSLPQYA